MKLKNTLQGFWNGSIKQITTENGIITEIGDKGHVSLTGSRLIETSGILLPGFIDIHVHGGGGADTMDASEEAFEQIAITHAKHGTTALLLTTITESEENIEKALSAYRPHRRLRGAEIIGFHLEGPFIHANKAGAQPKEYIQAPNVATLTKWMKVANGTIRYITIAPDAPGAEELIRSARKMGLVVSAGHTSATYEQANHAFLWGVQSVTHLFNAMSGLHHRDPGLVGAAFNDPNVYVEMIADKVHVHEAVMKIAWNIKGKDKVMLITDAIRAACMPEGKTYTLGHQLVTVVNGTARLKDGTIAGSVLTLDRAVSNLIHSGIIQVQDVIPITSANQSKLLSLPYGRIEIGAPANIIAVDDNWNVTHTFVRGDLVYRR